MRMISPSQFAHAPINTTFMQSPVLAGLSASIGTISMSPSAAASAPPAPPAGPVGAATSPSGGLGDFGGSSGFGAAPAPGGGFSGSHPPTAGWTGAFGANTAVLTGRFTDHTHVGVMLNPITGLFDNATNPPVSISEAVARLPFADQLEAQGHLWTVKKWANEAETKAAIAAVPGMTADLASAIWLYTCESQLYPQLNAKLESESRAELKQGFFPYLRLLMAALGKLRAAQGSGKRMVNRGVRLDLKSKYPGKYRDGDSVVMWRATSTTSKISVLSNPMFLGTTGDRTIFQILTSKAVDIAAFSAIKSEAELIIPPGTAVTITGSLKDASGLTIMTCEDDPDAPSLLN